MKSVLKKIMAILLFIAFAAPGATTGAEELSRTTLAVEGLTCVFCLTKISGKLMGASGVEGVRGDIRRGFVMVDHRPFLSGEAIAGAVTGIGYPARIESTVKIDGQNAFSSGPADRTARSRRLDGGARSDNGRSGDGGRGCFSCNRRCGASAAAWKMLFQGPADKQEEPQKKSNRE